MIIFFVIVQLLEIAPRTACLLESAFFKGRRSCTQAPVFHPAHRTCVLVLVGVSFERELNSSWKVYFSVFPSLRLEPPPPTPCASPGPGRRPGRGGCPLQHPPGPSLRLPYPLAHPSAHSVFLEAGGYARTKPMGSHFKTVCVSDFKIN